MQRMRTAVLMVSAALVAAVAVVAIMAASGSGDSRTTYAGEPPKPGADGVLSGVFDTYVYVAAKAPILYNCISQTAHDATTNAVKSSVQCYTDASLADPNAGVPCLLGEGSDIDCDGVAELDGPPPPPPYTSAAPTKLNGLYTPGTDTLELLGCFTNVGGTGGPNMMAKVEIVGAVAQLTATGKQTGDMYLYTNMSNDQCDLKDLGTHPEPDPLPINLHPADDRAPCPGGDCVQAPWRTPDDADYDDDGCSDWDELDKTSELNCGDDPYNPLDSNQADIGGSYSLTATAIRADWDKVGEALIPGAYFHCISDMQQTGDGTAPDSLVARVLCYIDSTLMPVNPQAGPETGDGLSGAAPPPPFADVDDVQTVLSGQIAGKEMQLEGCFQDRDTSSPLGNVFVRTVGLDKDTADGMVDIWAAQTTENCLAGTPVGDPSFNDAPLEMARQATKATNHDSDGDNCPNKNELSDNQQQGGLRDPYNTWDYFNPTLDGQNRVDDILAVVNQYFIDKGNPEYTKNADRTAVIGANPWNLGPPNGQQRVDDILAAVKSYFHDCDGGNWSDPDFPPKVH